MKNESNPYLIPASIIVSGALVAFAVFYARGPSVAPAANQDDSFRNNNSASAQNIRPVGEGDYILGNPDAPVKLVEFSDLECPFCKQFHITMKRVMEEYGKSGQVAWVYRHFPLDSIHSRARKEAEAAECAGELGGNTAFWNYVDRVFEITPSNDGLSPAELPKIAEDIGLNRASFESCLNSGRHAVNVEEDYNDAINSGGRGTPHSVVVTASGDVFPFSGALPYAQVKSVIDQALASVE